MRCEDVRALMPRMVDDDDAVELAAQRHIESCLSCQAALVRYQRMLRGLHELREVRVPTPEGLLEDTLVSIGGPSVIRVMTGRQKAAVAGAVGAVAAGAAATAVMFARRRGLRFATVLSR